jgi:hypothetical protein
MNINVLDWLAEQDNLDLQGSPAVPGADPNQPTPQAPETQMMANQPAEEPQEPDDITQDPATPDMPEQPEKQDFESWKKSFFKESTKGDTLQLMDLLSQVRDSDLGPADKKFVEDNYNVQLIRQNANVEKASKEIRRSIKGQLDKNNPATSVTNHITAVLESDPTLINTFIKINGYSGLKGDLHRKYVGALLCATQVGSGANTEDLVYNEKDYSILISTRIASKWGDVMLGAWSLREDDPEKFLSEPEIERLNDGSPEERDALRKRLVVESIAELFETRSFLINIVGDDGTLYTLGWDIANSLRSAYSAGKIKVRVKKSENSEALISDEGEIVPLVDISLMYVKETGGQTEDGMPEVKELEFVQRKDGQLFFKASLQTAKEAAAAMQGMSLKESPFTGHPTDLVNLSRCHYSAADLIMRTC